MSKDFAIHTLLRHPHPLPNLNCQIGQCNLHYIYICLLLNAVCAYRVERWSINTNLVGVLVQIIHAVIVKLAVHANDFIC